MPSRIWREWRFPVEFALLLALAFFLPLREAPKNLVWLAYIVVWAVNRMVARDAGGKRDFGGPWDHWDSLLAAWLASGYMVALFAGIRTPDGNEWSAVNDLVRNLTLAWCVRRAGYTRTQMLALLGMLLASAALGTLEALWRWKGAHTKRALELASVGHVNHSAIYLVMCAGIATGMLCSLWRTLGAGARIALAASGLLMAVAIFMTDSRAAFVASLPLVLLCAGYAIRAARFGVRAWGMVAGALLLALALGGIGSVQRNIEHARKNNLLAERDLIWNRALVAVRAHPWFGVGMDNFSRITDERLQDWLKQLDRPYQADEYRRAPHAHSLYLNTLAERGFAGLGVLLAVLGAWGIRLWRLRPRPGGDGRETALWCAALSGWFVTVVVGFANTSLHHEHAMLAVLTLALWLARPGPEPVAQS